MSAGTACRWTSRGTTVPTETEKFTLRTGCTFSRANDCDTRVRCWSLRLIDALTLLWCDCAVLLWFDGAGCCAVSRLALPGLCCARSFAAGGLSVRACEGGGELPDCA